MRLPFLTRQSIVSPVAFDISDNSIEAIQFEKTGEAQSLLAWSRQIMPAGMRRRGKILDVGKFSNFLADFFSRPQFGAFRGNKVVANVSEEKIYSHIFEFAPPLVKEVIENRL